MKRIFSLLLCVIFIFTGCSIINKDTAELVPDTLIGYCQLGDESSWRTQNTKSVLSAIRKQTGLQVMYKEANQKQENQIKALRSFIAYQVDMIVFSPIVETGWDTVLTEAKNAGIPVIVLDRKISTQDESLFTCFIGSDCEEHGIKAGNYLIEKFKDKEGPLSIVELSGTDDSTPAIGRHEGLLKAIDEHPKFKITESISGDFMLSRGREIIRNRLEQHGIQGMDILYSHNDEMTIGAIEELQAFGIQPGKDVVIITVDAQQTMIDNLKKGIINCAIECNPNSGELLVENINKILSDYEVEKSQYLHETVFTEFDDLQSLPPRGY